MDLIETLKDATNEAVVKSRSAVGDNAEKINSVIDSITGVADSRTGGKYSERITKFKDTAKGGVKSFAEAEGGIFPSSGDGVEVTTTGIPEAELIES